MIRLHAILSMLLIAIFISACTTKSSPTISSQQEKGSVLVVGAVNRIGPMSLPRNDMDAFSAISKAGGLSHGAMGGRGIQIKKFNNKSFDEIIRMDVFELMRQGKDSPLNVRLSDGDVLHVWMEVW